MTRFNLLKINNYATDPQNPAGGAFIRPSADFPTPATNRVKRERMSRIIHFSRLRGRLSFLTLLFTLVGLALFLSLTAGAAGPWIEQAELGHDAGAFSERLGSSVAVDGNIAVVAV